MADKIRNPRADSAKAHDDAGIIDEATEGPSQSGISGGNVARRVASRDEEKRATGDAGLTRVQKRDKIQPNPGRRSDQSGL
ncbi:MAG TPA: hypothetical protein VJM81_04145 [Rhizorhapis sp.]|nr:hypothetical protein [Rhizorhapis sp.]